MNQSVISQTTDRGVIAPRQQRSRSTHKKIVGAGRDLVRSGQYDQAGFRQILELAGVSVGAFYGRFKNKEALFHYVLDQFLEQSLRWAEGVVAGIEAESDCLDDALRGAVRTMIRLYQRDIGLMRAIYLRTRVREDRKLLEKVIVFNGQCYALLERMMLAHVDEINHTDPARAVRFGGEVLAAFLREAVFFGSGSIQKNTFAMNSKVEQDAIELLRRYLRGKDK